MAQKGLAALIILFCLFFQLAIPTLFGMPCETMTALIAFLWIRFGQGSALLAALASGLLLDILSFETPFGLFLFAYLLATFIATQIPRYFFQNLWITYLLFAAVTALLAPIIETALIMIRHHSTLAPPIVLWNAVLPALIDFVLAALLGLPALYLLTKRRSLR